MVPAVISGWGGALLIGGGVAVLVWGGFRLIDRARAGAGAKDQADGRIGELEGRLGALQVDCDRAAERILELHSALETANAAKEQLQKEARSGAVFLARMGHELRQPLTTVVGFSEILHGEVFGPLGSSRYRSYVAGIVGAGHSLAAQLNDLLDLCTIEVGELELVEATVDLRDLIAGCIQMFAHRALQRGCMIRIEASTLPQLWGDPRRLKQILANLLDDAIARSGEGSEIVVAGHLADDGGVFLKVRDFGAWEDGADGSRSELVRALSRSLAELHQGDLYWRCAQDGSNEAELWLPATRIKGFAATAVTECCST